MLHDGPRERPYEKRNIPAYIRDRGHGLRGQIIGWSDGIFKTWPGSYARTGFCLPKYSTWLSWDLAGVPASLSCLIISFVKLFIVLRRKTRAKPVSQSLGEEHGVVDNPIRQSLEDHSYNTRAELVLQNFLEEDRVVDNPLRQYPEDNHSFNEDPWGRLPNIVIKDDLVKGARLAFDEVCISSISDGGQRGRLRRRVKISDKTT